MVLELLAPWVLDPAHTEALALVLALLPVLVVRGWLLGPGRGGYWCAPQ
jgi:hypothetical protein